MIPARGYRLRAACGGLVLAVASVVAAASASTPALVRADDASPVAQALAQQGFVAIPLTRHDSGHVGLSATLNGVEGHFLLDTGAGRTMVESARGVRFALRAPTAHPGVATSAGGAGLPVQVSDGNRLAIGRYADADFSALLISLSHVNVAFENRGQRAIDGVIGGDVLDRGRAVIDYAHDTLYLRPSGAGVAVPRAQRNDSTR